MNAFKKLTMPKVSQQEKKYKGFQKLIKKIAKFSM